MDELFHRCQSVNNILNSGNEIKARDALVQLLQELDDKNLEYSPLINHLIRAVGLYPYIDPKSASWQERFVYEAFKVNVGEKQPLTLHREQSALLKDLLNGESVAVSAPTSFGKSFVIDAFISLKKPSNVVIIVPTIALADETRRRVTRKFTPEYKIITASSITPGEKNIYIFPQERAVGYIDVIQSIDLLVVDEFYKAGDVFDKERSPVLLKVILELSRKSKQRYFLAPTISRLKENPFTAGMKFRKIDFNTVYTEIHNTYEQIHDCDEKKHALLKTLQENPGKTLIYVSSVKGVSQLSNQINDSMQESPTLLRNQFSNWLKITYGDDFSLSEYVKKGIGIHTGRLHRSLGQIQIQLFEESSGLDTIVATSSIIEGINTSAEKIILWDNKLANKNLDFFTFKNIIGRGGRMFKHFVGKIYLLEPPPKEESVPLELKISDNLLFNLDVEKDQKELSREQLAKIIAFNDEIDSYIGKGSFQKIIKAHQLLSMSHDRVLNLARDLHKKPQKWIALGKLNSDNVNDWRPPLLRILNLSGERFGRNYREIFDFVALLSQNWHKSIPQLISEGNLSHENFFSLEREVAFKLASILNDVNVIQKCILNKKIDISPFVLKLSHAFLPKLVYELEEYGLPRMVSRKIQNAGLIDLEDESLSLDQVLKQFGELGYDNTVNRLSSDLHPFEEYILNYFFKGITSAFEVK